MSDDKWHQLLDVYINNSSRILSIGFGVNYAEADFFSVIRLLIERPELRNIFVNYVERALQMADPGLLGDSALPQELIELVAHELRWQEIKELADRRVTEMFGGDLDRARGDISHKIYSALSNDWEDREYYSHYQTKDALNKPAD